MSLEEMALIGSSIILLISFGMSGYSLFIQSKDYKLQKREVTKQNNRMIEQHDKIIQVLEKIAGV